MIPKVVKMDVYPVAGHDSMELNLSGAHSPFFTRNIVVLEDSSGNLGVGEVPGGQKITKALEDVKPLVVGSDIANYKGTLNKVRGWLNSNIKDDVRGLQTFDLRTGVHVVTAIEAPLLDLLGKFLEVPAAALMGDGIQRERVRFLSYLFYIGDRKKTDLPYMSEEDSSCAWYRLRNGVALGYAVDPIQKGQWIHEHMLSLPTPPSLNDMPYGINIRTDLPEPPVTTWWGYQNPEGGPAGTRNLLGIQTTVQCVEGMLNVAVERMRRDLLPKYPHVEGIVAINHAYGCGVAINAPEAKVPIRALRNIAHHPNFGGQLMVVALGCEKLTADMLVGSENNTPENVVVLQECHGFEGCMQALMDMAEKKLKILNERRREELPLSELLIGMQCGGSDAFSGVSANPCAGYAADMLVKGGSTVLFSEVTEVRDGVHLIAERCVSAEVRDKLAAEMRWYDHYLEEAQVDRSANPTPGNKKGGLSNIVEKAMGSIAKSGTSPIVEVLSPAERPTRRGEIFAATPASDIVCGPCQMASGIGLQLFMTGRGTPYNLAAVPVIKVSSQDELKEQWPDIIDISAGAVATGEKTIAEVGTEIFHKIIACASGKDRPFAEKYGMYNYLCIFNPAPIT